MHKCVNNSDGDVNHIEQLIGEFFPYSQKNLGFDKPVTIIFQSDPENASKMLGKTAYYDPTNLEVVLYTDNRHPKDIMRSLSHELVHHAQNCRGDVNSGCEKEGWNQACVKDTDVGYAQRDPHLRKMEREAYTKGNLIFRDFEDLIKTGKINVEIDLSAAGEPKMSLKEWKNNEINTKLMKKWGLLKESKADEMEKQRAREEMNEGGEDAAEDLEEGHEHGPECGCPDSVQEGWGWREEDDDNPTGRPTMRDRSASGFKALSPEDYEGIGSEEEADERGNRPSMEKELEEGDPLMKGATAHRMTGASSPERIAYEENPVDFTGIPQMKKLGLSDEEVAAAMGMSPDYPGEGRPGQAPGRGDARRKLKKAFAGQFGEGKISVREAKEITRRIIERIKKEGN
tara:strand:+ start:1963 stop:3162 length:1200 start_codon:yes stop_codon:yes gene_type:complete